MKAFLKSATLWLAALSVPLTTDGLAADRKPSGKKISNEQPAARGQAPSAKSPSTQSGDGNSQNKPKQQERTERPRTVQAAPAIREVSPPKSPSVENNPSNKPKNETKPRSNPTTQPSPTTGQNQGGNGSAAPSRTLPNSGNVQNPTRIDRRPAAAGNEKKNQPGGASVIPSGKSPNSGPTLNENGKPKQPAAGPVKPSGDPLKRPGSNNSPVKPEQTAKPSQPKLPAGKSSMPPDLSRKPADLPKSPVDLPKKTVDPSKKPVDLSKKPGRSIDPIHTPDRLPRLPGGVADKADKHIGDKQDDFGKRGTVPQIPNVGGRGRGDHAKVADGHDLHVAQPGNALAERLRRGDLDRLADSRIGKQVDLKRQLEVHQNGDLVRRLNLSNQLALNGGWQNRLRGPIDPLYGRNCFNSWYCGPGFFPSYCWFPTWNPWVNWCWNYPCLPICDPRPIFCRPIYYDPCPSWVVWTYPVWVPMPVVACGTWVEAPAVVVEAGYDVQLLAVRFVDPGHPEQQLGPRYRVWLRNNSPVAIQQPFNLLAYASNDRLPGGGQPEAGLRMGAMEAGQIQAVDLRLPFAANTLDVDAEGHQVPFRFLHVIADSHREVPEAFEVNNGAVLDRRDILPVDPAVFAADSSQEIAGTMINLAGEGFGPEPGQVLVSTAGMEIQAEIVGWYDLGVQVRLPGLAAGTTAELVVVRGDQAASNPLTVTVGAGNVAQAATLLQSP